MRSAHLLRAVALAGAFLCGQVLAADAAKPAPSLADFFSNPQFSDAELSPSGKYLAVRLGNKDNKRDMLGVVDLASNAIKVVGNFSDADIGRYEWVNDNRLVFTATDRDLAEGDVRYAPGLFSINRDGSGLRQLAMRNGKAFITSGSSLASRDLLPWHTYLSNQVGAQDSDYIYVLDRNYSSSRELINVNLLRLNTVTGRVSASVPQPGNSFYWMLDHKGEPRLTITRDKAISSVYYREPGTEEWRKLVDNEAYTMRGKFSPLAFGPDGTLYVTSSKGRNFVDVYAYDLKTGKLADKPLVHLDGYDFQGKLLMSQDKLLGIRHLTDADGTTWLDPEMKAIQEKIDQMLPNTANLLSVPTRSVTPWILVTAHADIWPKRLMLYNKDTGKLSMIGESHPAIKPTEMARKVPAEYKSRDGMTIPVWITLPQGEQKNRPMVVLVHGGPWVRGGKWTWDPQAQFLASRGYTVLEPEFRGSTGYGSKLFLAGWKQWGLKMQDDIADATRWAIDKGYADPKRICIAGASYGGYATLMGLIKDPDLYKCGFEWVGVTDINLMYDGSWFYRSDMTDDWKQYGMPRLIGDQVKDADQLKATSPLLQASKITQPLLMAYGGSDERVPLPHGTKFYKAIKDSNPNVEWIEYPEEGHGWKLPKTRIDFWGRVEKFLDKNIGAR
ncbi:prolyl oligopeptidase family serine peptidase [Duganella sp. sic0402]|uniref:alpha/beta hydrolase family protein n=1 Tax=Duganella sp. sic0402 TaxID=2854786 RepID=UPI001C493409|nr:alpha/beta fold hydrolase [Duganella sp. sic0402]MBV7538766.1 prolyl oligopeptidase family serine peptidase [Duganella sp. sic0402]